MKKEKALLSIVTTFTVLTLMATVMTNKEVSSLSPSMISAANKELVLNHSNAPEINDGVGILHISSATFTYTNASASSEGHVVLAKDGTITKDISKGLLSVVSTFSGSLTLKTGFNEDDYCFSYDLSSGITQEIRGNYLKFVALSSSDIQNITLSYNCRDEEHESHNMSDWTYDETTHERHCLDEHCHLFEEELHTLNDSGIETSLSSTSGTITYTCSVCGYSFNEDYVRTGAGKVALGSSRGGTAFDSKLGTSIQSYSVAAWRAGLTRIGDEGAVVFNLKAAESPSSDGTQTGAGFRIMTGCNQENNNNHTYSYLFKNMGNNTINFQVYGRNSSSDKSSVNAYDVSLEPGESRTVNVIFATQNANILSYFRFLDNSYQNASLAISLRYSPTATVSVTLTNALFDNGLATKELEPFTSLTGIVTEMNYIGFSDNLGNINSTSNYQVPDRNVTVTLLEDEAITSGSGKLNINSTSTCFIDYYSVNTSRANPELAYVGNELATVIKFNGSASGTDNTGTGASFRFRVSYNSGSGYKSNFHYTFKNLGTETLEFDVYQRSSGSDTSTPTYTRISIEPNDFATADIFWETNVTTNELTYVRFTEGTNWVNQKLAVYAYAEAYQSSYVRVDLAEGMTFDDGRSYGYFASGTTQNINNVPEPKTEGHVHAGYYLAESKVIQNSTTFEVPGANHRTVYPFYDVEAYYDHSTAPDLTNSYQKIDLSSTGTVGGGGFHPNAGRSGSFQDKKPTIGQAMLINNDGELEKCIKYTFSDAVTAGSHFLNMNAVHSTNKNVDSYFVIQNNGSETLVLNLYTTTSSGNPTATSLATNVTVTPGASVAVEKLNHGNGSNSNTMVCFEIVDALTSMDFSVVRYMRYHS